ncbi:hypothetical protein CHUAL_012742 [Chamberlinius hualienensis]
MDLVTQPVQCVVEDRTITKLINEIEATTIDKSVRSRRIKRISEESSRLDHLSIRWQVPSIENKLKLEKFEYLSEAFTLPGYDFAIQANLIKDGTADNVVYISIRFLPQHNSTNQPQMNGKAFSKVTYATKCDQDSKYDIVTYRPLLFSEELKFNEWSFHWLLFYTEMLTSSHLTDDCININITFEPFYDSNRHLDNNGILQWKLSNYKKLKQTATQQLRAVVESPYFYTSPRGYRLQAQLELNCSDELWMSVFFTKGEFDDELPEEFPHFISVTLINQKNSLNNKSIFAKEQKTGVCDIELANVKATEENGFVRENSLQFEISCNRWQNCD